MTGQGDTSSSIDPPNRAAVAAQAAQPVQVVGVVDLDARAHAASGHPAMLRVVGHRVDRRVDLGRPVGRGGVRHAGRAGPADGPFKMSWPDAYCT